ncbi:MAG: hypothetical protein JXA11_11390 [Phycisphaerae bacterium]|nr:hypothetical protein [Phycisphaerae bacterium]
MTHRERFLSVLRGQTPDRTPVVCRLDIWHRARLHKGDLPAELQGKTLEQIQLDLGMGVSARQAKVFSTSFRSGVEYTQRREGMVLHERWTTSKGELHRRSEYASEDEALGMKPHVTKYPIASAEDYALFERVMEHLEFQPDYDAYRRYDEQIGDDGLPMVILGANPFHDLMLYWVGYEKFYYDLVDLPDVVAQATATANTAYERMWDIVANSPCELVMHGVNFDSGTTPPPMFREHFLPYLRAFNERMHQAGKYNAFHADGDVSRLLDLFLETKVDVADCLAVAPMGRLTMEDAFTAWRDNIVLWGCVPSPLLEPSVTEDDFDAHLEKLAAVENRQGGLILGLADQAMPAALWSRIRKLGEFPRKR